jgi:vacuolar-type H+-ATPase subunit I/STV1
MTRLRADSSNEEKEATVEKATAAHTTGQVIERNDVVIAGASRIEFPRILEQLKRISALRVDDFILSSGTKLESTVKEMFSVIKDLEGHLRDVLTLNTTLHEEVRDARRVNVKLQKETEATGQRIAALERDAPRVQDLEKRLELAIVEVERFRALYRLEQQKLEKVESSNRAIASMAAKAKEERDDAYREIVVMEDKLKSLDRAGW